MTKHPFFSIIIPTYNRRSLLEKTINSFLKQKFLDFELIVVDDGGSDNSGELVKGFNDTRIHYYWKENAERGAARNFGVSKAVGKWINFFDSDDIAYPNHLYEAYLIIKGNSSVDVFHTSYDWTDIETGKVFRKSVAHGLLNNKLKYSNLLSCNNVFLKSDIAKQYQFSEYRPLSGSEDWLLWLEIALQYEIIGYSVVTSTIVQHGMRSMVLANGKSTEIRAHSFIKEYKEILGPNRRNNINPAASEMFSLSALHYAMEGNRVKAISLIYKALLFRWSILVSRRFFAVLKYLVIGKSKYL